MPATGRWRPWRGCNTWPKQIGLQKISTGSRSPNVSSRSRSYVCRDLFRLNESLKILVSELDELGMIARVEGDLFVFGQVLCGINLHAVEITEGRHPTQLASGESILEFRFSGQLDLVCTADFSEQFQVDEFIGRHHGHRQFSVDLDDDSFGDLLPGDVH